LDEKIIFQQKYLYVHFMFCVLTMCNQGSQLCDAREYTLNHWCL